MKTCRLVRFGLALTTVGLLLGFTALTTGDETQKLHHHKPVYVAGAPQFARFKAKLEQPRRLLIGPAGRLYVADSGANKVYMLVKGGKLKAVAEDLSEPSGLARDQAGNLYVSNHANGDETKGNVVKIAPNGKKTVLAEGLNGPKGLAIDKKGNLYVANFGANTIDRIDAKGKRTVFAKEVPTPAGLAFDREGNLFAVNSVAGTVSKITPEGKVSEFAKGFKIPSDIAIAPDGNVIVTNYAGTELSSVDKKGQVSQLGAVPQGTIGLVFDPDGNIFLVNWNLKLLFKRITVYMIPCPHCKQKIPVHLKQKLKKKIEL